MDVQGLGTLKDALSVLGGTQSVTAWGPAEAVKSRGLMLGRFLLMEDAQVNHVKIGEAFPSIGLCIDCNVTGEDHIQRLASNVHVSDFKYNRGIRDTLCEFACINVFDAGRRSAMLHALVPLVADCIKSNLDVVFHDTMGTCMNVLAMAAVQKSLTGSDLYVSDVESNVKKLLAVK
jgi:hypothetical protein